MNFLNFFAKNETSQTKITLDLLGVYYQFEITSQKKVT
jgi:hypothetical protein